MRKPHLASLDEVEITRERDYAVVEYHDSSGSSTKIQVGRLLANMSDQEVLDLHNDLIRGVHRHPGLVRKAYRTHMSAEAVERENALLDVGYGGLLRATGLQEGVDYIPIDGEQPCDYPGGNTLMGQELRECTRGAKFAKMVMAIYHHYDDHPD